MKCSEHMPGLCPNDWIQMIGKDTKTILYFSIASLTGQDMMKRHQHEINTGEEDPCDIDFK